MIEPVALIPFIPSGKDFTRSRELFRELGFEELWASDGYVGFQAGSAKFILQDFNNPEFASNLMVKIEVLELDVWWREIEAKRLPEKFSEFRIKPPTDYPWGREVNFIDLAGVCWHVGRP